MAQKALHRTRESLALAAVAGLCAVFSPPLALALIALLAARLVLMGAPLGAPRWIEIAAPLAAAALIAQVIGLAAGIGALFVWRLIADAQWSQREAMRLARIEGAPRSFMAHAHLWLTPAFGLSMAAYTAPHMVMGLPLDLPHVPIFVPLAIGMAAALALFDWAVRIAAEWRLGQLRPASAAHEAAHHALFLIAYATAHDVSAGLVALIAWRLAHAERGFARATGAHALAPIKI